ncbi:hypothetical protein ONZ45_g742 [Pleurotus djamor]|nr:hypothetical protein ONZ45_g742 [Pleurotus djamor]
MMHQQTMGHPPTQQNTGQSSYSSQPYGGQYAGQPYSGQPYPSQPYSGQHLPEQGYTTQQMPNREQLDHNFGGGGGGFGLPEIHPEMKRQTTLPNYEQSIGDSPMPQHAPPPGPPPQAHTTNKADDQFIGGFNPRPY